MSYLIIGYFIDINELKKLEKYETVTYKIRSETFDKNSCNHLSDESYQNKTPNYCPECGTKVHIIKGYPAEYTSKQKFIGYQEGFLAPFVTEKKCGCIHCNFCDCEQCDDCSTCKYCVKCKDDDKSYRRNRVCKTNMDDLKITDTELYNVNRCRCYYECDYACNNTYDKTTVGFDLSIGHKLMYDKDEGFYILYDTLDLKYHNSYVIDDGMIEFKNKVETFLNKFGMKGSFEMKIIQK